MSSKKIYLVMADTNGAHEADCLYSVWNNIEDAKKEAKRLNESGLSLGAYGGSAAVKEIEIDKSYDDYHDIF